MTIANDRLKVEEALRALRGLEVKRTYYGHDLRTCKGCGEPWCQERSKHWADYPCPKPDSEDWVHFEIGGVLFAARTPLMEVDS